MGKPSFGIFDHIEDIPGTPTPQLLKDRLDLIKMADEAGFAGFHLAEHHGTDLCMAPNQEVFIAAASQITKNIRLGPMVKLLPLHHPVRIIEDMVIVDNLTNGRLDFGVGRGVAPIEHYWFGSNWPESKDRFVDILGIICEAFANWPDQQRELQVLRLPDHPAVDEARAEPDSVLVPGQPGDRRSPRHEPDVAGPDRQGGVRSCTSRRGTPTRATPTAVDGPNSVPRVGCTMLLAIAPTESEALEIVRRTHGRSDASHPQRPQVRPPRAVGGGVRRRAEPAAQDHGAHGGRHSVRCRNSRADQGSLRRRPRARADRLHRAAIPAGDMTLDEAKRTMDAFCSEVKPSLEALPEAMTR